MSKYIFRLIIGYLPLLAIAILFLVLPRILRDQELNIAKPIEYILFILYSVAFPTFCSIYYNLSIIQLLLIVCGIWSLLTLSVIFLGTIIFDGLFHDEMLSTFLVLKLFFLYSSLGIIIIFPTSLIIGYGIKRIIHNKLLF